MGCPRPGRSALELSGSAAIVPTVSDQNLVGLVVGTEDSTPLQFSVALAPGAVPAARRRRRHGARRCPASVGWRPSGVVTQVRARHEGATFGSDVFLIADGVLPAQVQEIAEITTTRVEPECYVPPLPGALVRRATGRGARAGAVLRPDGAQGAGRARPRRRAGLRQPRVPRRHPRRARVDQRRLRGRDEDQLRAVPALLAVPQRGARARAR